MTLIDFAPGQHGHFLEYVVNNYIFNIQAPVADLFQQSGAAHNIKNNELYQQKKLVVSAHLSSYHKPYPVDLEKIICIRHDPELDFVLLTNIYYRCHPRAVRGEDVNFVEITQLHRDAMFDSTMSTVSLRNNWYTKLQERHFQQAEVRNTTDLPVFEFDYSAFFSIAQFVEELQRLAGFLNQTLIYNQSLIDLYNQFIQINQGFCKFQNAKKIVTNIVGNQYQPIDPQDWQLQAYVNYRLSRLFQIYDGELFESEQYPDNTQHIHQIVLKFLQDFDSRF